MIKELEIKHLKSFEDSGKLIFSQITLLTGKNGRGKSTVLQSLLLLAQSFDAEKGIDHLELNGRFVNLGTYDDLLRRGTDANVFEIGFATDDEVENDIKCVFCKDIKNTYVAQFEEMNVNEKSKMEIVASSDYLLDGNFNFETAETNTALESLAKGDNHKTIGSTSDIMGLRQFLNMYFVSANREGGVDSVKADISWNKSMGIGVHGEYVLNMLDVASDEQKREIEELLRQVLDGGAITTEKDSNRNEIALYIDPSGVSKGFKPSNVGFGYSYILSILITIVMARIGAKILIENPEAHLHPTAQACLMEVIISVAKKKNLQVFIESHSDHVLHGLQLAVMSEKIDATDLSVLFFDFEDDNNNLSVVNQLEVLPNGHIRRPPEGFFDQAEHDLGMLIGL